MAKQRRMPVFVLFLAELAFLSSVIFGGVIPGLSPAVMEARADDGPVATFVWDGGGSTNLASEAANWDLDLVPVNDSAVIWDATSSKVCTWDIDRSDVVVYSWTIAAGYTGTITQGSVDIGIGAGGLTINSGLFIPRAARWVYCDGDVSLSLGSYISNHLLNLVVMRDGATVSMPSSSYILTLDVRANATFVGGTSRFVDSLYVAEGKTLTLINLLTWLGGYNAGYNIDNRGSIVGGTLMMYYSSAIVRSGIVLGHLDCDFRICTTSSSAADNILAIGGPLASRSLIINTLLSSTSTMTLDTAGYPVSASSVIIETRGAVLWRDSTRTVSGNYDSSAASGDDAGTSHLILTGTSNTLRTMAGAPLYDVTIAEGASYTLQSDVTVTNRSMPYGTVNLNGYTWTAPGPTLEGDAPPTAPKDSLYSAQFSSDQPVTWSLSTDAAWLSINADGLLSGTPVSGDEGTYSISVQASNINGVAYWNGTVVVHPSPTITNPSPPLTVNASQYYHWTAEADQPVTWTISTDAAWLHYDGGKIYGYAPNVNATYYLQLIATNVNGTAYLNWTITVENVMNRANGEGSIEELTIAQFFAVVILALTTYLGLKYPRFFTITGFVWLAVSFFYIRPIDDILGMLGVLIGFGFMLYGVYRVVS